MLIFDFLERGEASAVTQEYLRDALGYSDTRSVRKEIEVERMHGYFIMSNESGYYLPANIEEMKAFVRRYEGKLRTGEKCVQPTRDFLETVGEYDPHVTLEKALKDAGYNVTIDNGRIIRKDRKEK